MELLIQISDCLRRPRAKLAYQGHVLMENRNGLVVNALLTQASGTAEREAALLMLGIRLQEKRVTVGGTRTKVANEPLKGSTLARKSHIIGATKGGAEAR